MTILAARTVGPDKRTVPWGTSEEGSEVTKMERRSNAETAWDRTCPIDEEQSSEEA
jgi:hypothetical protein